MWEKATEEDKEVIVALDANLDFLTWRNANLPQNHSSVKLKPLIDALFDRIIPLGVCQVVTGATRLMRNQPKAGLDHLYSNKPEKLSTVQTFITWLSDHKLIKVTRFSKTFRQNPRYIKKRIFKDFDDEVFKNNLEATNLAEIMDCNDVNYATKLLIDKITIVLDQMAPVKNIQTMFLGCQKIPNLYK